MGGIKNMLGDTPFKPKRAIAEALATGHAKAQQAADHAGEEWKDIAYDAFVAFAKTRLFPFTTEDVRKANPELPPPPDNRAWGHVALRASRAKIVKSVGQRRVESSHGMWKTLWETQDG
jgi:hypothetical protein